MKQIRVSVEVHYAGITIPDEFHELPAEWDSMTTMARDEYLRDLAVEALALHASSSATVVDENGDCCE